MSTKRLPRTIWGILLSSSVSIIWVWTTRWRAISLKTLLSGVNWTILVLAWALVQEMWRARIVPHSFTKWTLFGWNELDPQIGSDGIHFVDYIDFYWLISTYFILLSYILLFFIPRVTSRSIHNARYATRYNDSFITLQALRFFFIIPE